MQGLAVYCGEQGERAATPLLKVLSDFALSLENGVKKYDNRVAAEKRKAAKNKKEAEKQGKENTVKNVAPVATSSRKLLKASSLQPHVGVTFRAKKGNNTAGQENSNPMSAIFNAIKDKGSHKGGPPLGPNVPRADPKEAMFASIKNRKFDGSQNSGTFSDQRSDPKDELFTSIKSRKAKGPRKDWAPPGLAAQTIDPKQALLSSIKSRRETLPANPPTDGVPDRVQHINNTLVRKESRVLLVNRMLSEAPASVKQGEF